jgi:hypothetical protein
VEAEASEEDELSDDEFEKKLAEELAQPDDAESGDDISQEERERAKTLELASKLQPLVIFFKSELTQHRKRDLGKEIGESTHAAPSGMQFSTQFL